MATRNSLQSNSAPRRGGADPLFLAIAISCAMLPACDPRSGDSGPGGPTSTTTTVPLDPAAGASKPVDDESLKTATAPARALIPLSEYDGRIRRILVHVPGRLLDRVWTPLRDLVRATTPDTLFTLVCDSAGAMKELTDRLRRDGSTDTSNNSEGDVNTGAQADASLLADRIDLRLVERPTAIWARDRYISSRSAMTPDDPLPVWLVPAILPSIDAARRTGEREIPLLLNHVSPICRVADTPLVLEGGNVLATPRHVLIGGNAIRENVATASPDETRAALARTFRHRVFLISDDSGAPPINHIDLFITVIGESHLLVASPRLAADAMADADEASKTALNERLLITPDMPEPKGPDFTDRRAGRFDQIGTLLESAGYRVSRIPYADSRNGDFAVTYNNVLQETIDGQRVVYMPVYQIPVLDAAAAKVYQDLGFVVKPIDVTSICQLLGAIRCMANVVERD